MAGNETSKRIDSATAAKNGVPQTIFNAEQRPIIVNNFELKHMAEEKLVKLYDKLIDVENAKYLGRNSAEHKLVFLVGNSMNDITLAKDMHGQSIYADLPDHAKPPEIIEAIVAMANHNEGIMGLPRVLSEVADIFHNLIALTKLDEVYGRIYKEECIDPLANSLGFSTKDAYALAYLKYQSRLINPGVKNIKEEDRLIRNAITEKDPLLPRPTKNQIDDAYRMLGLINKKLNRRKDDLEEMHKWSPFKNGNHSNTMDNIPRLAPNTAPPMTSDAQCSPR